MIGSSVRLLAAIVIAAGAMISFGPPASASTTINVRAGSAGAGTSVGFAAAAIGIRIADETDGGLEIGCNLGSVSGRLNVGSFPAGQLIGSTTGLRQWQNCISFAGLELKVTAAGTWNVSTNWYNPSTGRASLTLSNMRLNVVTSDASNCSFTVRGSEVALFSNASQTLTIKPGTSTLTLATVTPCFGLWLNGDRMSITATFGVTMNFGVDSPLTITSL